VCVTGRTPFKKVVELLSLMNILLESIIFYFLQMSYKRLHFCSQACLIPIVDGQSNVHIVLSARHFGVVHDRHKIDIANNDAIPITLQMPLRIFIPPNDFSKISKQ